MSRESLGHFELLVLLALLRHGEEAYGVPIAQAIEKSTGKPVILASVYNTLERLEQKARHNPEQAEAIHSKIASLRRMVTNAKTVPDVWAKQVAHARTGKGLGMHAINIDGDIGPWLQAIKIKGLKESAARNGRRPSPA